MPTNRKILMACPNDWHSPIHVGDHHFADGFSKQGWQVAFVSAPLTPWHFFRGGGEDLRRRLENWKQGGTWENRVFHYVPMGWVAPYPRFFFRTHVVLEHWYRSTFPNVVRRLAREGFSYVDILYLRDARQIFWKRKVSYGKLVFRLADQDAGFSNFTPALERSQKELLQSSDLVVCTTKNLQKYANAQGARKILYLPNGVEFERFSTWTPPPEEYQHIPEPRAIYVGSLGPWVALDWLQEAARRFPKVSFVVIGPDSGGIQQCLGGRKNLYYLGAKPYARVPAYLHAAHVGLLPFDEKRSPDLVPEIHPVKLYEYLAAGLSIAASRWRAIQHLKPPVFQGKGREGFFKALKQALTKGPKYKKKGVQMAKKMDWEILFQKLYGEVESLRKKK